MVGSIGQAADGVMTDMIARLIGKKDSDASGTLNAQEFTIPEDIFTKIDTNTDSELDTDELTAFASAMKARGSGPPGAIKGQAVKQARLKIKPDKDEEDGDSEDLSSLVGSLFDELDINMDGIVDQQEFRASFLNKGKFNMPMGTVLNKYRQNIFEQT